MLITNSQRIDFTEAQITEPVKEANMYWISLRRDFPVTNRIKLQRQRYQPDNDHASKMFGREPPAPIDYFSVLQDEDHFTKEQYALQVTNPSVWSQIQFTIDMNLEVHTANEQTVIDIFAWFGGWFAFLYVFVYAFMRIIVPKV